MTRINTLAFMLRADLGGKLWRPKQEKKNHKRERDDETEFRCTKKWRAWIQ